MNAIYLVLYILAFVCFILAFFLRPTAPANAQPNGWWHPGVKVPLIALGLALWVLVSIIQEFQAISH